MIRARSCTLTAVHLQKIHLKENCNTIVDFSNNDGVKRVLLLTCSEEDFVRIVEKPTRQCPNNLLSGVSW